MKKKTATESVDPLPYAAVVAHQLKSPVLAAGALVKTMLEEYAGHLTPAQRDLLTRIDRRIEEAGRSVQRVLAIARPERHDGDRTDVAALVRRKQQQYDEEAAAHGQELEVVVRHEPAWARGTDDAVDEALHALLENALKYTPDNGRVRITVEAADHPDRILLSIEDSGIGIPEDQRDRLFTPFYRSATARDSARPGLGLGLAFVKAVVEAEGGSIRIDRASLGGAAFHLSFPAAPKEALPEDDGLAHEKRLRVVIIGGVAAGPKVAAKVNRLRPHAEVTIVEKGDVLSYAGCGLPYYISGTVREQKQLLSTPLGAVRDSVFFQNVKNVKTLNRTEAVRIDREGRRVLLRSLKDGRERWIEYDRLVLATGAHPVIPAIPGCDKHNIFTLHGVRDAEGIRQHLSAGVARDVVLIGGGLIAVEMTKALATRGCRVTIVETQSQIIRFLDWEMARLLEQHMESNGVRVLTSTRATAFLGGEGVESVMTERGELRADMVILAAGIRPETALAVQAGLALGPTGALQVNDRMGTADPAIFAAGDCVECRHLLTGRPCYVPLGSTANKQGRVAAINLCGGEETFPGVLGSMVCQVFDYCVARTGLTEAEALEHGYEVVTVLVPGPDREHFLPDARVLMLKLVVDRASRRLIGAQALGPGQGDKRIDVAATAITAGMTIDQVAALDLSYAPPYSQAMDNLITAANVIRNKLAGHFTGISPQEVRRKQVAEEDFLFLDVSSLREFEEMRIPGSTHIPLGALRGRLSELPRNQEVICACRVSLRAYEASLILRAAGFEKVRVLDGGSLMWPYEKLYGVKP